MNAEQVARLLGVSAKTVHRHIARGTISATYIHKQELSIPDDQVEKLRLVLAASRESRQVSGMSQAISDSSLSLSRHLEELTERLTIAEQKIATLERQLQASLRVPTQPERASSTQNTRVPAKGPEIASTEARNSIPTELPSGMLSVRDFAKKIGMDYTMLDGYARRGIRGEKMDVTEVPHPTRKGYTNKYFSSEQQEKAVDMLKRHGKLKKLLPEGSMLADDFAKAHGIDPFDFDSHMREGLGPGLIGMSTDTIPQRDQVDYSEHTKTNRPGETEKYLTADQQKAALAFWKRQHVDYSQCDQDGCYCHTLKQENE